MKILFTGGSSFTGYWFIKELASAGHEVVAAFRRRPDEYPDDLRRRRVSALTAICRPVFSTSFGDDHFFELIHEGNWDLFCNHGADVSNYKSPDFDVAGAVANNTHGLPRVLDSLKNAGCTRIVLTGSVFENDEGAGSKDLRAFSPYGLSKALTWQMFRYYAQLRQMPLGKFVIPNPFGPYEEPRFTH
jgi:UDP-glucose 4-epimerase